MASYKMSCLDSFAQNRYRDKLKLLGLKEDEDPYKTLWPPVSYGDIFCYLRAEREDQAFKLSSSYFSGGPWKLIITTEVATYAL